MMSKQNIVKKVTGSASCLVIALTRQFGEIGVGRGDGVNVEWDSSSIVITRVRE